MERSDESQRRRECVKQQNAEDFVVSGASAEGDVVMAWMEVFAWR